MTEDGLITTASVHEFDKTLARLEAALRDKGMTIFARVDHAEGAAAVGLNLRPTTVVVFGNPRGGTPLMQATQKIGLELPLKILVWEDASGKTALSYDDPVWLAQRFGLDPTLAQVEAISGVLASLADLAGRP